MKAKLIKREENYYALYNSEGIFISDVNGGSVANKLSIKNCQAIECGYDLDELLKKEIANGKLHPNDGAKKEGIERGIQIALEIFSDKKFSEEDLRLAMHFGRFGEANNQTTTIGFIQSLQQTEWKVEIEMVPALSNNGNAYYGDIPKLDADGCLILKRI